MKRFAFFCALVLAYGMSQEALSQITSSAGNPEIYTRKTGSTQFGILTSTIMIDPFNGSPYTEMRQKGILFTETYSLGTFDPLVFGGNDQLVLGFEGALRGGLGFGSVNFGGPWGPFERAVVKYYVGVFDPFAVELAASYTHMFWSGKGLAARFGVTLLNIGATGAMMEKGTFKDDALLVANILPVQVSGSIAFDFGRSELGVSFLFNYSNILTYSRTPDRLFDDDSRGVVSKTVIKKSAFQVFYGF